jgi:hypothetical protein
MVLVKDIIYQNGPINLYTALFSAGYKDYESKKWAEGLIKFKRVVDLSDLLIAQKIINIAIDTNSILLAGIMGENSNNSDEAAKYYSRLADAKIGLPDYEGIYRYLVRYYFTKKDMTAFDKYKAIGAQLYPNSDFFKYDKVDFAVGLEDDFNKKLQGLRDALANDQKNAKAWELLGELIYDTLHPKKDDSPLPANADQLEKEMIDAFRKSGDADPSSELAFLYLGQHFILKSGDISEKRDDFIREMGTKYKPGQQPSKADQDKLAQMDAEYGPYLENAREPFEKAAAVFAKKTDLRATDKAQYKKVVGYLADIAAFKKTQAKGKPADQAKWAAEEKKWNDLYDTIK